MSTKPELYLYDTQQRTKRAFTPLDENHVGMYVCGITPYDDAHLGHARVYVVFDVLYRLLRHLYGENAVKYVRNFTDIDDKIIARAAENGEEPMSLANRVIASFHADMDALNVLRPTLEPRVSDEKVLKGIATHIDALLEKDFAYVTNSGDVMYRTKKFPRFGQLANRKLSEQQHGSRVSQDDEKEAPEDFVLWKANEKSAVKLAQAFNPKDLGATRFAALGRPGWHIECSVMSEQSLGKTFDIHGGGEDLKFPHHCCEIAQSEALLPDGKYMANYWLHNAFITVGGTKMSKSLGNFTTIKDVLSKNYTGGAIRLWLLQTHYRKPVDFSKQALDSATNALGKIKRTLADADKLGIQVDRSDQRIKDGIINILANDLDTAGLLSHLFVSAQVLKEDIQNQNIKGAEETLTKVFMCSDFLGLGLDELTMSISSAVVDALEIQKRPDIKNLLDQREQARQSKDWKESDRLRDELKALGIIVEDGPNGTTWRRA